jgi:hypothetical protein
MLLILIGILWIPFELTIAPERHFRITDPNGNPISSAKVRQHWDQYALELHKAIDLQTSPEGEISLPRRFVRTNLFSLIFGGVRELVRVGRNAGLWSYESIGVAADGFKNIWIYEGKGLESGVIILEKEK